MTAKGSGTATLTGTHKTISSKTVTKEVRVGGAIDFNNVTVELQQDQYTYTGQPITPKPIVKYEGVTLTEGSDYKLEYANNTNVSNTLASITIVPGANGGTNSKTFNFKITPADISRATIANIDPQPYTGKPVEPKPLITFNGVVTLANGVDYTLSYRYNTDPCADYAEVIATGSGNFTGTTSKLFSIVASFNDVTVEPIANVEYTGKPITLTSNQLKVTYNGMNLTSGVGGDFDVTYANNTKVGTATVTLKPKANGMFSGGSKTVTFKIVARNLAGGGTEISNIPNQTYTGFQIKPAVTVKCQGTTLKLGTDYNITYSNNTNVGTGKITITGKAPNYTGSVTKEFTIKGIQLTSATTLVHNVEDKIYNGAVQTQDKLQVVFKGKTLVRDKDYRVSYRDFKTQKSVAPKEVGEYEVVITGIGEYSGTITRVFPIYAKSSGNGNSSSNTTNKPNKPNDSNNANNSSNSSSSNNGLNPSASQAAPTGPTVTGTWKKSGGKWWFSYDTATKKAQSNKSYPTSQWVKIKGKLYHFDSKGWMHAGWYKQGNYWYYLGSDGAMKTGWQKVKGKWYYMAANGIMQTGKIIVGGQTYYLISSGAMKTGWNKETNGWYYYKSSGAMAKGWQKVKSKWYYLDPQHGLMKTNWQTVGGVKYFLHPSSGAMLTGWAQLNGVWYYFKGSGAMTTGWQKVKNTWYYLGTDGAMKTGFYDVKKVTYYSNSSGAMQTGWKKISNKWYYFNKSGAMQKNTWIGTYHLNANGVWDTSR